MDKYKAVHTCEMDGKRYHTNIQLELQRDGLDQGHLKIFPQTPKVKIYQRAMAKCLNIYTNYKY